MSNLWDLKHCKFNPRSALHWEFELDQVTQYLLGVSWGLNKSIKIRRLEVSTSSVELALFHGVSIIIGSIAVINPFGET